MRIQGPARRGAFLFHPARVRSRPREADSGFHSLASGKIHGQELLEYLMTSPDSVLFSVMACALSFFLNFTSNL